MRITRRDFAGGALGVALTSQWSVPALGQRSAALDRALAAIREHAAAHVRHFGLPGLTVGLSVPGASPTILDFGHANADARTPIGPDTLFQVGSISKVMTAALVHQLAARGTLRLTDRVGDLLPAVPLPRGNGVTVQHLLDHTSGLPDFAPVFPDGGLWLGFEPGSHWHYSNTGYEILGKVAEQAGRRPLARLLHDALFGPLAMSRTRGAIVSADRLLYAQGYEPTDSALPWIPGEPLGPAPWVELTSGAGSVASTSADMVRFMRSLADAAQGRGGLGLAPAQARQFTLREVASDRPGMRYGNGLMHLREGSRSYLHHTGGMLSFTSAFHLDVASGAAAFASSTLGSLQYRPRLLTRFAADALTNALAGQPLPAPPQLEPSLANPVSYVGHYSGPGGAFEVRSGNPLTILAGNRSARLLPWGGDSFGTAHPRFRAFGLKFERKGTAIAGAAWGSESFVKDGSGAALPQSDPALARLSGRYASDNPWYGTFIIVERGGRLWLGTETPLHRLGDNAWRVGDKSWSPERAFFADIIDGRPQTLIYSGVKFTRRDV